MIFLDEPSGPCKTKMPCVRFAVEFMQQLMPKLSVLRDCNGMMLIKACIAWESPTETAQVFPLQDRPLRPHVSLSMLHHHSPLQISSLDMRR